MNWASQTRSYKKQKNMGFFTQLNEPKTKTTTRTRSHKSTLKEPSKLILVPYSNHPLALGHLREHEIHSKNLTKFIEIDSSFNSLLNIKSLAK